MLTPKGLAPQSVLHMPSPTFILKKCFSKGKKQQHSLHIYTEYRYTFTILWPLYALLPQFQSILFLNLWCTDSCSCLCYFVTLHVVLWVNVFVHSVYLGLQETRFGSVTYCVWIKDNKSQLGLSCLEASHNWSAATGCKKQLHVGEGGRDKAPSLQGWWRKPSGPQGPKRNLKPPHA